MVITPVQPEAKATAAEASEPLKIASFGKSRTQRRVRSMSPPESFIPASIGPKRSPSACSVSSSIGIPVWRGML
jgi:hypothetical protein